MLLVLINTYSFLFQSHSSGQFHGVYHWVQFSSASSTYFFQESVFCSLTILASCLLSSHCLVCCNNLEGRFDFFQTCLNFYQICHKSPHSTSILILSKKCKRLVWHDFQPRMVLFLILLSSYPLLGSGFFVRHIYNFSGFNHSI